MDDVATMRADCARCAALCCVALAFDRSESFAIDKPNGLPCPHLCMDGRCNIYAERESEGFGGCVRYDCLGAGQRVTQELFGGRSWRDDPSLLAPMVESLPAMREVHELLILLDAAGRAPLSPDERRELDELKGMLRPADGWTAQSLAAFRKGDAPKRVRSFLTTLRRYFAAPDRTLART